MCEDGSLHGAAEIWGRVGGNSAESDTFPRLRSAWEHPEGLPGMGQSATGMSGVSQPEGLGRGCGGTGLSGGNVAWSSLSPYSRLSPNATATLGTEPCCCGLCHCADVRWGQGMGLGLGPLLHPKGCKWSGPRGGTQGKGTSAQPHTKGCVGMVMLCEQIWRGEKPRLGEEATLSCSELLWQTRKGKLRAGPGVANSAQSYGCFQHSEQEASS